MGVFLVQATHATEVVQFYGRGEGMNGTVLDYLKRPSPHKLEIGSGAISRAGWLSTDLEPRVLGDGTAILGLDATKEFDFPNDLFDYIYSEHMIEHIPLDDGLYMLTECFRVLKPGGLIRVVTPAIEFLEAVMNAKSGTLEEQYYEFSMKNFIVGGARLESKAVFLNNFMRSWGHAFVYDRETLKFALAAAGFVAIEERELNASSDLNLANLAHTQRMPPGFLELESMVFEATKPVSRGLPSLGNAVNVAIGKEATQSSISEFSREASKEEDASRVVSGVFDPDYNNHTGIEINPWWMVDLEEVAGIVAVRIYNRRDRRVESRLNHFDILISEDNLNWNIVHSKTDSKPVPPNLYLFYEWRPSGDIKARYVKIRLRGQLCLHLNQVEIFARPRI